MWILIALGMAVSEATKDIYHSQERVKSYSPILKAWVLVTCSLPVVIAYAAWNGMPVVETSFWPLVAVHVSLMCVANVLYMRALALGPLSQTQPILALTTVFLVFTNPLMTNEHVPVAGWIGVMIVGVGIYATQHPGPKEGASVLTNFLSPFVEMMKQPGVVSKLGVALIFSMTANLDRLCIDRASGPFYLAVDLSLVSITLGAVLLALRHRGKKLIDETQAAKTGLPPAGYLLGGGSIHAITILLHVWALSFAPVPYVIAIKRLSILLASGWGAFVRKDRKLHWFQLVGTVLVVAGIGVITFFGRTD